MKSRIILITLVIFFVSGNIVRSQVNQVHHPLKDTLKVSRDSIVKLILIKDSLILNAKKDSSRMSKEIRNLGRIRDSLDQTVQQMIEAIKQDSADRQHEYERNRWINRRTRIELKEPVNNIYEDSVKQTLADLISIVYEDTAFSPNPRMLRYSFSRLIHHLVNDSIHFRIINSSLDTIPFVIRQDRIDSTAFFLMNTKQDSAKIFMRSLDRNTIAMWLEDDLDLKRLLKRQAIPDRIDVKWQDATKYRIARKPPPPQPVKLWNSGAEFNFYISQVAFSHWAKGGSNNIALTTDLKGRANYAKGNLRWDNNFLFTYGIQKAELVNIRKSLDRLELRSNLSHKAFRNFDYNVGLSLISQSFKGYDYPNDSVPVSNFLAPGYIDVSTGMVYRPDTKLTVSMSPAAGKFTMVLDTTLAKLPRYGNQGKLVRPEVGARVEIGYRTLVLQNVNLTTNLKLFSSYVNHPEKVDVDWTLNLDLKVNKYLTAAIKTQMMYDDDVLIPLYEVQDGKKVKIGEGKRLQIYEYIGVGFKYIL